jgi:Cytochrome c7 and related cytochrome c
VSTGVTACGLLDTRPPRNANAVGIAPGASREVFTPAHATFGDAVRDYFYVRPAATQPIPFPHHTHIEQGLTCTDYCHEAVTTGPRAGLPSVSTCMICHEAIATDKPLIQQITAARDAGHDLPWQRVYGWPATAHVRFNHAPHIRKNIECATCHGDVASMTVAEPVVKHTMGFCVDCHRANNASNDCLTCHF